MPCREVLAWAIEELRDRVPPRFEVQARDFLRVHRKGGQACPRCGTTLSEVAPGGLRDDLVPRLPGLTPAGYSRKPLKPSNPGGGEAERSSSLTSGLTGTMMI